MAIPAIRNSNFNDIKNKCHFLFFVSFMLNWQKCYFGDNFQINHKTISILIYFTFQIQFNSVLIIKP